MDKLTITLRSEQVGQIDDLDTNNRSEAIRTLIDKGLEYDNLKRDNERLKNEKQTILSQRNENRELVEYLQTERELQVQDRERRREKEDAPIWKRLEWLVFGRD